MTEDHETEKAHHSPEMIPGIAYFVYVRYNMDHARIKSSKIKNPVEESEPLATYKAAEDKVEFYVKEMQSVFKKTQIVFCETEDMPDEFTTVLIDHKQVPLAYFAIGCEDYREFTKH